MAMMRHHQMGDKMHKLNLTDAQKQQMKTVNEDYRRQLTALQSNNSLSLGDYKTQLTALQKSHRDQVKNVFTDEQKKVMADRREKMKTNMQARGTARLDKMKTTLGLTDDQVAKIKTQREQLHTQATAIRKNDKLLPEEKRNQMRTLFSQQKEQLKTVLTPDQITKLESMKKDHIRGGGRRGGQLQAK